MDDMIKISRYRYEQLLDIETRVNVAVERILHKEYMETKEILWILGTDLAVETAMELDHKDKEKWKEYNENHEEVIDNESDD